MDNEFKLSKVIDSIWQSKAKILEYNEKYRSELTINDVMLILSWDFASAFNIDAAICKFEDKNNIQMFSNSNKLLISCKIIPFIDKSTNLEGICYEDIDYCIINDSADRAGITRSIITRKLSTLLMCLQFIKYRLDDALLLPPELRLAQVNEFCKTLAIDYDFFRSLVDHFNIVEEYIS